MKRCVIIGGANIGDYGAVRRRLNVGDFNIYCDSGLSHQQGLGAQPHLIVGDFDSHPRPHTRTETILLPCEKDDTDTAFAVKEAVKRGFDCFLLIGTAGGRLDHTLANLSLLLMLDSLGKRARMVDDYSEMEVVSRSPAHIDGSFAYFSLLSISGAAKGVTVSGAKYPLENAEITCEYPYGVSNEPLPGSIATVRIAEGRLLLIKVFQQRPSP